MERFLDVELSSLGFQLKGYDACLGLIFILDEHVDVKPLISLHLQNTVHKQKFLIAIRQITNFGRTLK